MFSPAYEPAPDADRHHGTSLDMKAIVAISIGR